MQQPIEVLFGIGVTFLADQGARQMQLHVARLRIAADEIFEEGDCIGGQRLSEDLRLEQRRHFPVGTQFERASHLGQRTFGHAGRTRGHGDRVVRLGHVEERTADLFEQHEDGQPVLVAREHAVEPEQVGRQRLLVGLQQADQTGRQIVDLVRENHHADQHLLRAHRLRFDLEPGAYGLERDIEVTRIAGDFDRPFQHLRIARTHRQIGVGLRRQFGVAALQRDLGEQHLIHDLARLVVESSRRRVASRSTPGAWHLPKPFHLCRPGDDAGSGVRRQATGHRQRDQVLRVSFKRFHGILA